MTLQKKINSGMAVLETLPLIIVFVTLLQYGIGFWGVVHTAVLHSIGARHYAFETFLHRADLTYFRDGMDSGVAHYLDYGFRVHGIYSDDADFSAQETHVATLRPIGFGLVLEKFGEEEEVHNNEIHDLQTRNRKEVNPVWIMTNYGICLNSSCGE